MKKFFTVAALTLLTASTLIATTSESQARSRKSICRAEARLVARQEGGNRVGNGALAGAAIGGLFGAVTGQGALSNTLTGVAAGGVGGGILGAATTPDAQRRAYWAAYQDCMDNY